MRISVTAALFLPLLAASALAEDLAPSTGPDDYRDKVYIACSVVFISIAVYLVLTHRKGAKLDEELAHLEQRIDGLEK